MFVSFPCLALHISDITILKKKKINALGREEAYLTDKTNLCSPQKWHTVPRILNMGLIV